MSKMVDVKMIDVNVVISMTEKTLAAIVGLQASQGSPALIGLLAGMANLGVTEIARVKINVQEDTHIHDALAAGGVKFWLDCTKIVEHVPAPPSAIMCARV